MDIVDSKAVYRLNLHVFGDENKIRWKLFNCYCKFVLLLSTSR